MTTKAEFLKRCGLDPQVFMDTAAQYKIPEHIMLGIISQESGGRPRAFRFETNYPYLHEPKVFAKLLGWTETTETALQRFSYGLMQIMLATARSHGFDGHPFNLLDPATNIAWGCYHLNKLFLRYGKWSDAIAAYNFGHAAKRALSSKYKNQDYVDGVMKFAEGFRGSPQVDVS